MAGERGAAHDVDLSGRNVYSAQRFSSVCTLLHLDSMRTTMEVCQIFQKVLGAHIETSGKCYLTWALGWATNHRRLERRRRVEPAVTAELDAGRLALGVPSHPAVISRDQPSRVVSDLQTYSVAAFLKQHSDMIPPGRARQAPSAACRRRSPATAAPRAAAAACRPGRGRPAGSPSHGR